MSLLSKVIEWIKSLKKNNIKSVEIPLFHETNKPWNNERIVYSGTLKNTKLFNVTHYLICHRMTAADSKKYWEEGKSMPTHWVKFIYFTKQGSRIPLIDRPYSFIKTGFKPDNVAIYVISETAKRIVIVDKKHFFELGDSIPKIPTRKVFLRDEDGYAAKFWEAVISAEFNLCQTSLGR